MDILLSDGYYIDVDNLNFILKRKTKDRKKDGQEHDIERTIGYFGNLKGAVIRFIEETNKGPDEVASLREYADRVERSNKQTAMLIANRLQRNTN